MRYVVTVPENLERTVRAHLFQNNLEQGAFLFGRPIESADVLRLEVADVYLVPPEGWETQHDVYLEMTDAERAQIMKLARDGRFAIADCHSHPASGDDVWFSPSDRRGITEFAAYAKWKLDGRPYTAMVWGEASLDAVAWYGDFRQAQPVHQVHVLTAPPTIWTPRGTWSLERRSSRDEGGDDR
ncbi:MAG: hypothetical protein ACYDAB_10905 [bacterium]